MKDVRVFKLITGEEIIAGLQDASSATVLTESVSPGNINTVTLLKPMMIQIQQVGPGQIGLVIVPWSLANQQIDSVDIKANMIVADPFMPNFEVEKQYLEQVSGLKLL